MDRTYYTPITGNRGGMLAVACTATLSLASIFLLAVYSGVLLRQHFRQSAAERMDETRAIKFLTSTHGLLLGNLLFGDLFQALGFSLNFRWVALRVLPTAQHPDAVCTTQGVLIQAGDLGSAFSSIVICVNLFLILVFSYHPPRKWLFAVIGVEWTAIALMTFIGPVALEREGIPFYGPAGGWCWLGIIYQSERLTLHYLFVFISALVCLSLYAIMAWRISQSRRAFGYESPINGTAGVAKVMMAYPFVYIATILPLSCYRIAGMTGKHWSLHYALAAGTIFTLSGFCNCLIYALTRSIVSLDSLGTAMRRGSNGLGSLSHGARRFSSFVSSSLTPTFTGTRRNSTPSFSQSFSASQTHTFGSTFALKGVRVDVATEFSSPPPLNELGYGSPPLNSPGKPVELQLRRGSAGERAERERPFSMLDKLEEGEDEEEESVGSTAEGEGVAVRPGKVERGESARSRDGLL
ncbi:hypothetical protein JCM8547_006435 [Rhodosporidiobolus lusitaniae]